jgi:hypothetical protein
MPRAFSPIRTNPSDWLELLLQAKGNQVMTKYRAKVAQLFEVPPYLLGSFWKSIVLGDKSGDVVTREQYAELLRDQEFRFHSEIRRDINRTFPNLKFYMELRSLGQSQLFNVLKAYSIFNPEVGYCQGMGFIVGMLLCHMDELDAFNVLVSLMRKDGEYNMQGLYKPGLPLLNEFLAMLEKMIASELPRLADHFTALGIETSMFASQWILTVFVYNLEWSQARYMFNLFLIFKMDVVLKFALYILQRCEGELLTMGFEEVLGKVNNMIGVRVIEFMEWLSRREDAHLPVGVETELNSSEGNSSV